MASELIVQTLKGPTSGANANKVIIPSGQTLDASVGGFTPASGQIIQVVRSQDTGATIQTTSTSHSDTGWSVDITPTSTSSIIEINATIHAYECGSSGGANYMGAHVEIWDGDNSTNYTNSNRVVWFRNDDGANKECGNIIPLHVCHSPSTTSTKNYKVRFRISHGGYIALYGYTIVAKEIAG
jgi:hypothetical protein